MMQRPHLQQIADLVGVSKMTVSRALRDGTSVDPGLRTKIRETAAKLRYRPNARISSLMRAVRKSSDPEYLGTLGFIWTHHAAKNKRTYFERGFFGASERADQLGYRMDEIYVKDEALTGRALSKILHNRGISGVLIAPPENHLGRPHAWLDWNRFCCVLIGRSMANSGLARVYHDHFSGTFLAIRQLRKLHYKRIGLIMAHSLEARSGGLVRSGFLNAHPAKFQDAAKLIYASKAYNPDALAKWFKKTEPDAIIANFEAPFPRLQDVQTHLPKHVALASLNWDPAHPEVGGVKQELAAIGQAAIDLVVHRLQNHQQGLDHLAPSLTVPGTWVDGLSLHRGFASTVAHEA